MKKKHKKQISKMVYRVLSMLMILVYSELGSFHYHLQGYQDEYPTTYIN